MAEVPREVSPHSESWEDLARARERATRITAPCPIESNVKKAALQFLERNSNESDSD
jgi:hypothetical protein